MKRLPKDLQSVLWSRRISSLNRQHHRDYIIHYVLQYGTLEHVQWLLRTYRPQTVRQVFLRHPIKVYSPSSLYFTKNFLLGLTNQVINRHRYLAASSRHPASRRA